MTAAQPTIHSSSRLKHPIILVVSTLIVFSPLLLADFCSLDDSLNIWQNPNLNPPTVASVAYYWSHEAYGLYIPVTYTIWAGLAMIARVSPDAFGVALNPMLFHGTNILVHIAGVLLAFKILELLFNHRTAACAGAMLFALHPVQVEPVAWAAGLKDVLAGMWSLAAIYFFLLWSKGSLGWSGYLLGTIALILGMLSKPSALVVPLVVFVIEVWLKDRPWRKTILCLTPWFALSLACAVIGKISQPATGVPPAPIWARPLIVGDALAFYLYKLVLPINLAIDYGRRPAYVMGQSWFYFTWLVPTALAILLLRLWRRWRTGIAAGAVFVAALFPTLGLVTFLFQYFSTTADHYLYLAMFGPAMVVASLIRWRTSLLKPALVVLPLWAVASFVQAQYWKDDISLFQHNLNVNPNSLIALDNLAHAYDMRHQPYTSAEFLQKAVELYPSDVNSQQSLAGVLGELGRTDESIAHRLQAIHLIEQRPSELRDYLAGTHNIVGKDLQKVGRLSEARDHFQAALKIKPDDSESRRNLTEVEEKMALPATQSAR
ncbi:MAG TPA: hypothetical protein VHD56_00395 [Tepidisphaeraceae bacterium]|nr:hypothetical protein [Tepidisphaeraceae bacterium]